MHIKLLQFLLLFHQTHISLGIFDGGARGGTAFLLLF